MEVFGLLRENKLTKDLENDIEGVTSVRYEVLTPKEKELVALAKTIWDDEEFLIGILCDAKTAEDQQLVIDNIICGKLVTSDDVILFCLELFEKRQEQRWKDYLAGRKDVFAPDEEELIELLTDVWEDYDFFILVLNAVATHQARQSLIRFLKSDPDSIAADDVLEFLSVDF